MYSVKYRNGAMNLLFSLGSFVKATTLYFGISTSKLNNDGTGIIEPSASSGYARVPIVSNSTNWSQGVDGTVTNAKEIKMNEITIDSGTAPTYFLCESLTSTNAEIWGDFDTPRVLQSHTELYIPVGEAKFTAANSAN